MDLLDRLLPKVQHDPETGCLVWVAARSVEGYGRVSVEGRSQLAHRVVWELYVGPIPEGMTIDHLCNRPSCVNIAHLRVASQRENILAPHSATLARRNSLVTECPQGHPYDEQNTNRNRPERRDCRACGRAATRRWRDKRSSR